MSLAPLTRLLPYSFRQIDLASRYGGGCWKQSMRYLAAIPITILLSLPAMSVELFRCRGAAMDGGTLEYIFEGSSLRLLWREGLVRNSEHFLTTRSGMRVRSCAKSDPGSAQTKESRLRTRTRIALTSGIRQHGYPRAFKGGQ